MHNSIINAKKIVKEVNQNSYEKGKLMLRQDIYFLFDTL